MLKVDLHIHTSDDPVDHIKHSAYALIDRAASLRFHALAVTLHDRQLEDECLRGYARERGITLLPGVERTIKGKHVVLVNFSADAERVRNFDELRRLKARSNGLVIAPHPFFPGSSCLGSLLSEHAEVFDAVEWSYFWTRAANFNARARRWADERGKPVVGNSDLHDLRQLGRTYTQVDAEADADDICEAVRDGRVRLQTEAVPVAELVQVFGGMVLRGRKSAAQLPAIHDERPQLVRPLSGVAD